MLGHRGFLSNTIEACLISLFRSDSLLWSESWLGTYVRLPWESFGLSPGQDLGSQGSDKFFGCLST